ncbi:MAG TPA: hypothetical protein VN643_10890 [Pyrinomonadaceae bacterium]|nr:hypothetical protein [Pyrinomonadaceae bacterium]
MGGHPYWYFVDYQSDVEEALQALREREFLAGRYNPVMPFLDFPLTSPPPSPGAKHKSIAAAVRASLDDGTRSILDIERIGNYPRTRVAFRLEPQVLEALYGTSKPNHQMVEEILTSLRMSSEDIVFTSRSTRMTSHTNFFLQGIHLID